MRLLKLYNKSKKSINKSSINSKYAISFKAYELLKRYVVKELVSSNKLDSAYPKNTKWIRHGYYIYFARRNVRY